MVWYGVHPMELLQDDPMLYADIRSLVVQAQLQLHPDDQFPSQTFVLRADTDHPECVYIHVGEYTPNALDRFTIRMLEQDIGAGGAGVKPRGVAGGYQQVLSAQQSAVMAEALQYMANKTAGMNGGAGGLGAGLHHPFGFHTVQFSAFGFLPLGQFANALVIQDLDDLDNDGGFEVVDMDEDEMDGEEDNDEQEHVAELPEEMNNHPNMLGPNAA